jgi:hypothetical protein
MLGFTTSYLVGYGDGEDAAAHRESMRRTANAAVDQSYINELHAEAQGARDRSRYNADLARQWIAYAKSLETEVDSLKSQLADLSRISDERKGLNMFMNLASFLLKAQAAFLLKAQAAGKASRPEFAELRTMALEIAAIHNRGDFFGGFGDQPQKLARFQKLWDDLAWVFV